MAEELVDFRGRITPLTDVYLEAECRATGREKSEVVREILHGWGMRRHEVQCHAAKALRARGIAGNVPEHS